MRVYPLFPAPHLYPSDTEQTHARRAGMRGLRHKARHNSGSCNNAGAQGIPEHVRRAKQRPRRQGMPSTGRLGARCHQSSSSTYRSRRTRSLAFHVRALHRGHRIGGASDRNSYSHFSQCQAATSTLLMARFVPQRREREPLLQPGSGAVRASNCFPARQSESDVVRGYPNVPDGWTAPFRALVRHQIAFRRERNAAVTSCPTIPHV